MNLNQLRVFHTVATVGTVTGAANALHVSQPAVSKQLKELELAVGAALFDRVPRGLSLTQVGELMLGHTSRIFAEEASLKGELAALLGVASGRLSVGASTTIGNYLVPTLFGLYRELHPAIELELVIANTQDIQRAVLDNRVDLGLVEGGVQAPALETRVFGEDEMVAIVAPGDPLLGRAPLTPRELAAAPLIAREPGSGTREVIEEAFMTLQVELTPRMVLGSTEAIKQAVAARLGVAMVSRLAVQAELASGQLSELKLSCLPVRRRLYAVRLIGKRESPALGAFMPLLSVPSPRRRPSAYRI